MTRTPSQTADPTPEPARTGDEPLPDPLRDLIRRFRRGEPAADEATARLLLRVGLAAVFVWFGLDKFVHTGYWAMWVPDALAPVFATDAGLYALGLVEVGLGAGLLWQHRWLREVALATAAYLALIVAFQGVVPVVRDLGLLGAATYLALRTPGAAAHGADAGGAAADADRPTARAPAPEPSAPSPQPTTVDADPSAGPSAGPSADPSPSPSSPAAATDPSGPPKGTRPSSRRTWLAAVVLLVGLLLGAAIAAGGLPAFGTAPSAGSRGALLAVEAPEDGATLPAGDLRVRVRLDDAVHRLGVNHVHVKVDGQVLDAVYFQPGQDAVETTVQVFRPGPHRLTAYLAYNDHTEYEGSATAVQVTVE